VQGMVELFLVILRMKDGYRMNRRRCSTRLESNANVLRYEKYGTAAAKRMEQKAYRRGQNTSKTRRM
jgi:hypothetical protein